MIAADLITWRAAHGLTLDQLAGALDVNRMTLWKWEKGQHPIPHMVELALWAIDHGALKTEVEALDALGQPETIAGPNWPYGQSPLSP